MKKINKVLGILAGVCLTVGIAVMIISGIMAHNNGDTTWKSLEEAFHSASINIFDDDRYESEEYSMIDDQELNLESVNSIQLTGNYGKVEIKKGDKLSYQVYGNDVDSSMITHNVDGDTWRINVKNRSGFYFFGIGNDDHISKLVLTVPSTKVFNQINIKLSAGTVDVDRLAAKTMRIEMGAGNLKADELVGEDRISLAVSAGNCQVDNIIGKDPEFRCDAGRIDAKGILTGKGQVKCGVGQINLNVVGIKTDYDYTADCGIGQIRIDGSSASGISNNRGKVSGASNNFNLDCGVGQINLNFVKPNV